MEKFREAGCPENEIRGAWVAQPMKDDLDLPLTSLLLRCVLCACLFGAAWGQTLLSLYVGALTAQRP